MFNRIDLNGNWKLIGCAEGKGTLQDGEIQSTEIGPIDASVPGEVHPALFEAALIPDPFYGENADQVQWVEEKEWWYVRTFNVPEQFTKKKTILTFDGLDTFAAVYLNGREIAGTANMFIPHSFDITNELKDGEPNTIAVRFDPAVKVLERMDCSPYFGCFNQPRVNARKQQCSFGWDWTHRLVGAGVWRGVRIVSYDQLAISDIRVQPVTRGNDVDAWLYISIDNFTGDDVEAQFIVVVAREESREKIEFTEFIPAGGDTIESVVRIENPEFWYPKGIGEQPLYTAMVGLSADGEIQDVREEHFGIRTVELIEESDAGEPRFILNINGQNVFSRGANWIPADHFPSRVTPERYRQLIQAAVDANFNMLRVWGGGIYEDPVFYRLCDEMGIMVWQDFMFACATYPDHPDFCREVERETREVVRSLRNHPSIVLWCGNNENEMNMNPEDEWAGKKLFHEVIPAVVAELDSTRPYRPCSPFGGRPANSPDAGDHHGGRWFDVAFGDVSDWKKTIEGEKGLFLSEFPTQGPPVYGSVVKFIPEDQLHTPTSPAWEYHNKDNPHSGRTDGATHQMILAKLTRDLMGDYASAEEFCRKGGVLQGEFLKAEIDHYRRRRWETSGSLFWMYNDCWPAVSWSVIDYYLAPKVSYYYVKRAYQPIALSFAFEGEAVSAWVANDSPYAVRGTLELSLVSFGAGAHRVISVPVSVGANASVKITTLSKSEMGLSDPTTQCLTGILKSGSEVLSRDTFFFDIFGNVRFPKAEIQVLRQQLDDFRHELVITSSDYARTVTISNVPEGVRLSDNYFDVAPGDRYEVIIKGIEAIDAATVSVEVWG